MLVKPVEYLKCIGRDVLARNGMFRSWNNSGLWVSFLFGEKTMEKLLNNGDYPLMTVQVIFIRFALVFAAVLSLVSQSSLREGTSRKAQLLCVKGSMLAYCKVFSLFSHNPLLRSRINKSSFSKTVSLLGLIMRVPLRSKPSIVPCN